MPSGAVGIDYGSQDLKISKRKTAADKAPKLFRQTFCSYDICKHGPRNMKGYWHLRAHSPKTIHERIMLFLRTFVGNSIMCLVLAFSSFACYIYYAEQQGKVIHDDLRRIRKKWTLQER